jgi:hypothetical protein
MKKLKKINLVAIMLLFFAGTLLFIACNKTNNNLATTVSEKKIRSIDYEKKYDLIIQTIAYGLLELSNNSNFKSILNAEIQLQFDGDDNVLMKKLSNKCTESGIDLALEMRNSLINNNKQELIENISEAINGFDYFDTKLYGQVFIPFIENKNLSNIPKLAMNFIDEDVMQGLQYNESGTSQISINEKDAQNSLIWVISINETVDVNGELYNGPSNVNKKIRGNDRMFRINKINVSDKKEGWGNGRADIAYIGCQINTNTCALEMRQGLPLSKVSNANLNTWYNNFCTGMDDLTNGSNMPSVLWQPTEQLPIMFFEEDRRKIFQKSETLIPSCSGTLIYYISKETKYGNVFPIIDDYPNTTFSFKQYVGLTGMQVEFKGAKF